MNTHDIGDLVRIYDTVTDKSTGLPIDPSTLTLVLKAPDGTSTTYTYAAGEITKTATGQYEKRVTPTLSGTYRYRWTSTGTGQASEESGFQVRTRRVV